MEEIMNTKDELKLMDEIREANKKHVEEFIQAHMKIWVADYGFIDRNGVQHDEEGDEAFPYGSNRIQVEALDIQSALDEAKKQLLAMAGNRNWLEVKIYDVGMCNDNIW